MWKRNPLFAKYVYDHKMTDKKEITIETGAGVKTLQLTVADARFRWFVWIWENRY